MTPRRPQPPTEHKYFKCSPTCQVPTLWTFYEQYFGCRSDGCFVEVGAFDGEYTSNTSGLADIGWVGYYIEPVPEYYQRCKARHAGNANVVVSRYAIGSASGNATIHVGGALSTISHEIRENFDSLEWAKGRFTGETIEVAQVTLDEYLAMYNVEENFELLVVDVEGHEWQVLRSFDILRWKPQMVIIELHDQNDDYLLIRDNCNKIVNYFDDNAYKVIFKDRTNTIYVPKNSYPIVTDRKETANDQ